MKSTSTALLLTLLGVLGIAGLQYLYLEKYGKFVIWLLTLGLFGLGTLIDLFTIGGQVKAFNTEKELDTIRAKALK